METDQADAAASNWFGPQTPEVPRGAVLPVPMEQALQSARPEEKKLFEQHREQDSLLKRMNEALRASTNVGAPPNSGVPASWNQSVPNKPLIFGPAGLADEGEGDLWRLVQPALGGPVSAPGVASFEEALKRADSSLEKLVGRASPTGDGSDTPIIEASVESVVEAPTASDATRRGDNDVGDPTDPTKDARLRRQRLLRRAMENMGTMPNRANPPLPGAAPPAPLPIVEPSASTNHAAPTAIEGQLATQIDERLKQLKEKKELYAILSIPVGAGKEQVKSSFLTLAKVFHPDRLPASLPKYQEKMTLVFESIREAYETLYDDSKRAAYLSSFSTAAAAPPKAASVGQTDDLMKMGEFFFKKRDYRQAEDHFARAYAKDKKAASLAAQAWAVYMDPSRKAEAQTAKDLMIAALKVDAQCDRAHYQLGVIARVEGDISKAEIHFKQAVQLNPRHLEASQELRLIDMRKKKTETKKGFFR